MNCKESQGKFSDYVDKVLPLQETVDLEAHLAECTECARELADWRDAASALSQVIACDAVPRKSLDDFVAACTAEPETSRWSAFVRSITSPRHVIASTVAGSVVLTSLVLMLAWGVGNGIPSMRIMPSPIVSPARQYEMLTETADMPVKKGLNNGTHKDRRSGSRRTGSCIAAHPACSPGDAA